MFSETSIIIATFRLANSVPLCSYYVMQGSCRFCSSDEGDTKSFEPLPAQHSCSYKVRLEDIGRCLRCECMVTDVFGRSSEPAYAETAPIVPGPSCLNSSAELDIVYISFIFCFNFQSKMLLTVADNEIDRCERFTLFYINKYEFQLKHLFNILVEAVPNSNGSNTAIYMFSLSKPFLLYSCFIMIIIYCHDLFTNERRRLLNDFFLLLLLNVFFNLIVSVLKCKVLFISRNSQNR